MENSPTLVFWSPVPSGSTLNIKAAGDENVFDVTVGRSREGEAQTPVGFSAVVPGPFKQAVGGGDAWAFTPIVAVFSTPQNPVTLEASITDASGSVVAVGGVKLEAQWAFASEGANLLKILVS